jgi:hypothetical protein
MDEPWDDAWEVMNSRMEAIEAEENQDEWPGDHVLTKDGVAMDAWERVAAEKALRRGVPMDFEEAGGFVLPLGKHKGKKLDDVAQSDEGLLYLDWLAGQEWVYGRLAEALKAYLTNPSIARDVEKLVEGQE